MIANVYHVLQFHLRYENTRHELVLSQLHETGPACSIPPSLLIATIPTASKLNSNTCSNPFSLQVLLYSATEFFVCTISMKNAGKSNSHT